MEAWVQGRSRSWELRSRMDLESVAEGKKFGGGRAGQNKEIQRLKLIAAKSERGNFKIE